MLKELCHATLVDSHKMHQTVLTEVVSPNVILLRVLNTSPLTQI